MMNLIILIIICIALVFIGALFINKKRFPIYNEVGTGDCYHYIGKGTNSNNRNYCILRKIGNVEFTLVSEKEFKWRFVK